MKATLLQAWDELLPGHHQLGQDLLDRWSHPRRHYHGVVHLSECLTALRVLGTPRPTEQMALWFHDAIHTNSPGIDENHSAEFAESALQSILPEPEVAEVARLIRLTIDHKPTPDDDSGARVCDADLAVLAAPRVRYTASVAQLRAESPSLSADEWTQLRLARLEQLLTCEPLFHTALAHRSWTPSALANLRSEFQQLKSSRHAP